MSWLAAKIFFDKVLLWCKKYWQVLLGAGVAVGVMILTAGRKNELKKALEIANKKAQEDKDAMEESHRSQLQAEKDRAEEQRQAADSLDPFGWMDWLLDGPFKGVSDQLNLTGSPAGDDRDDFALPERFEDAELSIIARSLLLDDTPALQQSGHSALRTRQRIMQ